MQEQNSEQSGEQADLSDVRIGLGDATELTLGSGGGSSEDKRYIYN